MLKLAIYIILFIMFTSNSTTTTLSLSQTRNKIPNHNNPPIDTLLKFSDEDFPGSAVVKNLPADTGDMGSVPGSGRTPGEGNDNYNILA